jgi:glycogen operon protein
MAQADTVELHDGHTLPATGCSPLQQLASLKGAMRVYPGSPYPLGATWDGMGVNFSLFSEHATKVELCLFEATGASAGHQRIEMREQTDMAWHVYMPDVRPGQLYGYRVHGPYEPASGHRFNSNKVVLDPYAKAIGRPVRWADEMFGYQIGHPDADLSFDARDNAHCAPLAAVIDPAFNWGTDQPPRTAWHDTVIYEAHVKGFTILHPDIPENLRGTYGGLTQQPIIDHLKRLGITAIEFMPVHQHIDDRHLVERGLSNYWGYNTLSYFAPETTYASVGTAPDAVREFKTMVRTLHAAGIEVILDVVYNHTAEGSHLGPTLSLRGIDNAAYYRLVPDNPRYHLDFTGTGNTLNMRHPRVLQLIMDSLRYWIVEMHVDGFRFDLASALARELYDVDQLGAFFDIIHQDPVISQVKLIAEPWDLGSGGYQVGNFPVLWTEWNGKYRDTVRRFWRGDGGGVSELATRIAGSSDLYGHNGRRPYASINFVTAHDGFTLHDLVSYNDKHNQANGEENRDGESNNLSWNCGVEGPADDPAIIALREQVKRNFFATLLLSQGVPMICGGDEIGRTQGGNNNAYCQDNEISWTRWDLDERQQALRDFVARLVQYRHSNPVLCRQHFFSGRSIRGANVKDITWVEPSGKEMSDAAWHEAQVRCLGVRLDGDSIDEVDRQGRRLRGETILILLNAHHEMIPFRLSAFVRRPVWQCLVDTAVQERERKKFRGGSRYELRARSLACFRLVGPSATPGPETASVDAEKGVA